MGANEIKAPYQAGLEVLILSESWQTKTSGWTLMVRKQTTIRLVFRWRFKIAVQKCMPAGLIDTLCVVNSECSYEAAHLHKLTGAFVAGQLKNSLCLIYYRFI